MELAVHAVLRAGCGGVADRCFHRLSSDRAGQTHLGHQAGDHPAVRFWVRNVDRKPNTFWLQLSSARFYPDFVAMLTDGRILVVEYKGAHLIEDAKEKLLIGDLWAEASDMKCLFVMPTGDDFSVIDRAIA